MVEVGRRFPGLSYRQLDHWVRKGWIRCTDRSPGSGVPREISPRETRVLTLMVELVQGGMEPGRASEIARRAVDAPGRPISIGGWRLTREDA